MTHITNYIRSLPAKYWSVEICQLTPEFSEIIRHTETVRHCADSVLQELEVTAELRRVVGVGDHPCSDGLIRVKQPEQYLDQKSVGRC